MVAELGHMALKKKGKERIENPRLGKPTETQMVGKKQLVKNLISRKDDLRWL